MPTQECFDANPLTFVEDVSPNTIKAPKHPDPKYSDRAYIHPRPAVDFVHKFQLPENLEGDLVLIQVFLDALVLLHSYFLSHSGESSPLLVIAVVLPHGQLMLH